MDIILPWLLVPSWQNSYSQSFDSQVDYAARGGGGRAQCRDTDCLERHNQGGVRTIEKGRKKLFTQRGAGPLPGLSAPSKAERRYSPQERTHSQGNTIALQGPIQYPAFQICIFIC